MTKDEIMNLIDRSLFADIGYIDEDVFVEIRCLPIPLCHTQNVLRILGNPSSSI